MSRNGLRLIAAIMLLSLGGKAVRGQQEIQFVERFALAEDRRDALLELIPGTDEYYYFHCLHYQNEQQLALAQSILDQWKAKVGETAQVKRLAARQYLLSYVDSPERTLDYLRRTLGLNLDHAPPSLDRAAQLPNSLDTSSLDTTKLLEAAIAADRSLGQIETSGLGLVLQRPLAPDQLRALLGRLRRADLPGVVQRIAEELSLKDSRGFGWAKIHSLLTLEQLRELLRLRGQLLENDNFVRTYTHKLAPREGTSLSDKDELRDYLNRLLAWARQLPPAQNSFKALVTGNLLRLDMSEGKYDRKLLLEYLALPRSAPYYDLRKFRNRRVPMAELGFTMNPQVPLPAIGDDSQLVRRYLEHFFRSEKDVDAYAQFLNRDYLERVFAETKILYGIGDAATWYGKLPPGDQKQIRERIEVRFSPQNHHQFSADDSVGLDVELKNVEQLIVKIYKINTLSYYRNHNTPISTSVDLDGLVANAERKLEFSQPAERRHTETIELPELEGRGVWVVDLLGGGQRSRALIQKGNLIALERLGDAGHVFEIVDETGRPQKSAHIELGGRKYEPDEHGRIIVPYAEKSVTRNVLLVDGDLASPTPIKHRSETYDLQAGFLLDRQALIAGKQSAVAINARLTCNGRPISIRLLEEPVLTVSATDSEGISTTQTIASLDLDDGDELVHSFLVPQRLASLNISLTGRVYNQNRDERQTVRATRTIACNAINQSNQIGDFFLRQTPAGNRLLVLGRNGEPIARLPVTISAKVRQFKNQQQFNLATDASGAVQLGHLPNVDSITVSAQGIQSTSFSLANFYRSWPGTIHASQDEAIELPLGKQSTDSRLLSLHEVRRGSSHATQTSKLELQEGSLRISGLEPGDYLLNDYETNQRVRIIVADGQRRDSFVAGKNRLLQVRRRAPVIIRQAKFEGDELVVRVDGADDMTRVHIIGDAFLPDVSSGRQLQLPFPPLLSRQRSAAQSRYVDSLRLDEEYSYILDRQGMRHYPGNMLTPPSLLVHPWEVSVTENQSKQAASGDQIPDAAAPSASASEMRREAEPSRGKGKVDWQSFDFLAGGAALMANLGLKDGELRIPVAQLKGSGTITVVAVHPTTTDSRQIILDENELLVRDLRLRESFDPQKHLMQTQRVELLAAGEKKVLGDPKTRRLQTYATVADVFQLYGTLLNNPQWEKFRFVTDWHQLSQEQRQSHYNEMACHELNFFLYHKDREFFNQVVRPLIQQKLDKQLVDLWLLARPLDEYDRLWRTQRLNTLERILLASRVQSRHAGAVRWLSDSLAANPLDPQWRQRRFEAALRGRALQDPQPMMAGAALGYSSSSRQSIRELESLRAGGLAGGRSSASGGYGLSPRLREEAAKLSKELSRGAESKNGVDFDAEGVMELSDEFFGTDRLYRRPGRGQPRFFQSLDKTREWAETQYYQVRLSNQTHELIPPNPFWHEYMSRAEQEFLPNALDLPCGSINEALCALAVIDLPFEAATPAITMEDEQLVIESQTPAIVFLESIEETGDTLAGNSILVGQDIYLSNPSTGDDANQPVQDQPLLRGIPYRASVVVTNPTSSRKSIQVLTQLPTGSIPLGGSKVTRSTSLDLDAYSTSQVEYAFYFPSEGESNHYGAQISHQSEHIAATDSQALRVLAKPESVDKTTWSYVADWGSNEEVLEFLDKTNLWQIDLSRIAFRMKDKQFYRSAVDYLSKNDRFEPSLWAYAVLHNEPADIEQLLQNRPDFLGQLGPVLESPLVSVRPQEQMSYEHLDYKPLVVARIHRLGPKKIILNSSLYAQYHRLLDGLASTRSMDDDQRMQVCYYMLLQNRIDEALTWFETVNQQALETNLQYDYFDAYLNLFRGQYDQAARIAGKYAQYPVPRWHELFAQVATQVQQRSDLLSGQSVTSMVSLDRGAERDQRILTGGREKLHAREASEAPALQLTTGDGHIVFEYRNIESAQVNYYLMDIELLFSRNPFVARDDDTVPVIQPNLSEQIELSSKNGSHKMELPPGAQNRNLLVEVTAAGVSRSRVITASSLSVTASEPYGQIQVLSEQERMPIETAYVKVYARHQDGSVRFYKDGYTDLRGRFDYATLSTSDLDTADRFAILVLHPEHGAVVLEASPPTR